MDTLGLHVFGLPDLQCHFRGREPGEIAGLLYATATYVFDEGDVIADGNTISGLDPNERYVCRREPSLLEPSRPVIDVDLGPTRTRPARDAEATRRTARRFLRCTPEATGDSARIGRSVRS